MGLLSRNVVLQGTSPFSQLDRYGGHVMMHSRGDESLVGRIENVECRYMGQGFRLGRYPIHFHMIGTVRNSYVRSVSIHHTYNRAIAIHGVHYLRVQQHGHKVAPVAAPELGSCGSPGHAWRPRGG